MQSVFAQEGAAQADIIDDCTTVFDHDQPPA
jgi:hypothetical protein